MNKYTSLGLIVFAITLILLLLRPAQSANETYDGTPKVGNEFSRCVQFHKPPQRRTLNIRPIAGFISRKPVKSPPFSCKSLPYSAYDCRCDGLVKVCCQDCDARGVKCYCCTSADSECIRSLCSTC